LKVGVVGLGRIAQMVHLTHLKELPDVEISAVCDASEDLVKKVSRRYVIREAFTDYTKFLEEVDMDAIINCTNTAHHKRTVLEALRKGKHVFVEKPLCYSPSDAEEMIKASAEKGLVFMVGYMKRYDPGYELARSKIQEMENVFYFRVHNFFGGYGQVRDEAYFLEAGAIPKELEQETIRETERQLRHLNPKVRGVFRALCEFASHDANAMRGIFRDPKCVLRTEICTSKKDSSWSFEGPFLISLLDYGGMKGTFEFAYVKERKYWDEVIEVFSPKQTLSLVFANPALKNMPAQVKVIEGHNRVVETTVVASHQGAFKRELIHFLDCIERKKEPETSGVDGKRTLDILTAIVKSYTSGKLAKL